MPAVIISWSWKFGDGGTSAEEFPNHHYNMPGVYTVILTTVTEAGNTVILTYVEIITEWSETSGELNVSYTDTMFRYALKKQQGINLTELTGSDLPFPEARGSTLKVYDDLGQYKQLFLDAVERLWYHISTRLGPVGSGLSKIWKDKEGVDLAIEGITLTAGNPVSVNITDHDLLTGKSVKFADVTGTTELNDNTYVITVVNADNFTLDDTDGRNFTAWVSDGTATRVGTDPVPSFKRPEDRGESEQFFIQDVETNLFVRPEDETKRDATGYDSDGFVTGIEFTLNIFVDGNQSTVKATTANATKKGEIILSEDAFGNRLQYEVSVNKSEIILVGIEHKYIVKDITSDPDTIKPTEASYEEALASGKSVWLSRNKQPLKNLSSGVLLAGAVDLIAGPDGKSNSAINITTQIPLLNSAVAAGTLMIWHKAGYTIAGIVLTQYNTKGDWIMSILDGVIPANLVLGVGNVFDFRIFTSQLSAEERLWYYNNINDHNGSQVLRTF